MADSISGLKSAQLNEIKKWINLQFTNAQIAQTMGLTPQKVSAARKYLKEHPYV